MTFPEKFYFEIFSKTNAVSITFGLRYIHWQSLKEINFETIFEGIHCNLLANKAIKDSKGQMRRLYANHGNKSTQKHSQEIDLKIRSPQTVF